MEKKILNIVVAPLIYKNKILLLQRTKPPFKNLWGLPGGKVEFGEHIDDAIQREIFEETSLLIEPKKVLAVLSEVFYDKNTQEDYWHTVIFLCEVVIKNPAAIRKSQEGELQWFDLNNLPESEIISSDYEMIKQIVLKPTKATHFYKIRMLVDGDMFALDYFKK